MRPDSPTSVESGTGVAIYSSSRLLAAPLGLVQQVGQVPGKLLDLVTSKPTQDDDWGEVNYLGGTQPANLVAPGPRLQRWDDAPNGR